MTNEEAMSNLKQKLLNTDMPNTIRVAISALEKQIPKKPERNSTIVAEFFHKISCYTCPTCGNGLLTKMMNERQNTRFCWDCGQRLDWTEGEVT